MDELDVKGSDMGGGEDQKHQWGLRKNPINQPATSSHLVHEKARDRVYFFLNRSRLDCIRTRTWTEV